jgi:hypothetical protein
MSPRRGSTPRLTDWPSVGRNLTSWMPLFSAGLAYSSSLETEAVCSSETSMNLYLTSWRHIPQDSTPLNFSLVHICLLYMKLKSLFDMLSHMTKGTGNCPQPYLDRRLPACDPIKLTPIRFTLRILGLDSKLEFHTYAMLECCCGTNRNS